LGSPHGSPANRPPGWPAGRATTQSTTLATATVTSAVTPARPEPDTGDAPGVAASLASFPLGILLTSRGSSPLDTHRSYGVDQPRSTRALDGMDTLDVAAGAVTSRHRDSWRC